MFGAQPGTRCGGKPRLAAPAAPGTIHGREHARRLERAYCHSMKRRAPGQESRAEDTRYYPTVALGKPARGRAIHPRVVPPFHGRRLPVL